MTSVYVIDTSYLLELFKVPGKHANDASETIKQRFELAYESSARLYVTPPTLFELANHIANIPDGNIRREQAIFLSRAIRNSVNDGIPWVFSPSTENDVLLSLGEFLELCDEFGDELTQQGFGLTDISVISQSVKLKAKYLSMGMRVHIWTRDKTLKAREPDVEEDAFV